jgi:hypothetical protein
VAIYPIITFSTNHHPGNPQRPTKRSDDAKNLLLLPTTPASTTTTAAFSTSTTTMWTVAIRRRKPHLEDGVPDILYAENVVALDS